MSGDVEKRALLALYRNHPATAPGDRYNWKAHTEARRLRDMLLGWAATQPDESLLHCRNLGPAALRWIRDQTGDPPSPFADLQDENERLRAALDMLIEHHDRLADVPDYSPLDCAEANAARAALDSDAIGNCPECDAPLGRGMGCVHWSAALSQPEPLDPRVIEAFDRLGGMWSWSEENGYFATGTGWVMEAGRLLREVVGRPAQPPETPQ